MKQTIDEAIEVFNSCHNGFTGCAGNLQDSIDVAVDIMRRYQKIQRIVKHWIGADYISESPSFADTDTIEEIIEVLEDGND